MLVTADPGPGCLLEQYESWLSAPPSSSSAFSRHWWCLCTQTESMCLLPISPNCALTTQGGAGGLKMSSFPFLGLVSSSWCVPKAPFPFCSTGQGSLSSGKSTILGPLTPSTMELLEDRPCPWGKGGPLAFGPGRSMPVVLRDDF